MVNTKAIYLKVKQKSLAEEARIIRKEENKLKLRGLGEHVDGLANHRKQVVGVLSRATHLARAMMKGLPYKTVEPFIKDETTLRVYVIPKVVKMVWMYGNNHKNEASAKVDVYGWLGLEIWRDWPYVK